MERMMVEEVKWQCFPLEAETFHGLAVPLCLEPS